MMWNKDSFLKGFEQEKKGEPIASDSIKKNV